MWQETPTFQGYTFFVVAKWWSIEFAGLRNKYIYLTLIQVVIKLINQEAKKSSAPFYWELDCLILISHPVGESELMVPILVLDYAGSANGFTQLWGTFCTSSLSDAAYLS